MECLSLHLKENMQRSIGCFMSSLARCSVWYLWHQTILPCLQEWATGQGPLDMHPLSAPQQKQIRWVSHNQHQLFRSATVDGLWNTTPFVLFSAQAPLSQNRRRGGMRWTGETAARVFFSRRIWTCEASSDEEDMGGMEMAKFVAVGSALCVLALPPRLLPTSGLLRIETCPWTCWRTNI